VQFTGMADAVPIIEVETGNALDLDNDARLVLYA
jgi:hypothetical protein